LGRRRGWLLLSQVLLIISIFSLGQSNPEINLYNVAILSLSVTFFSASQDIIIDAYRRESLLKKEQTIGASAYVLGYRFGALAAGAGGLILADVYSYSVVYTLMALIMLLGVLTTFIANEPKITAKPNTLKESIIEPFKEFFSRYQVDKNDFQKYVPYLILLFVLLYKVGDTMAHSLSTNFYLEIGFSKTEIGTVVKFFGLGATLIGAFMGGVLSLKIGLYRSLMYFGAFQLIATLGFAILFYTGNNIVVLISVITLENLAAGMGYTAYLAFIANMTSRQFTATQFALMTALMSLPRTFLSGTSGFLVEILDWDMYFIFCSLIAIPALLILKKIRFIIKDE
jgi:PAT family beta-lactamase induction signal transducer AmpG